MIDIICNKCGKMCGFGKSYLLQEIAKGRVPRCFKCDAILEPPEELIIKGLDLTCGGRNRS